MKYIQAKLCSILFIFNKRHAKLKIFNLVDELMQSPPHFIQIGNKQKIFHCKDVLWYKFIKLQIKKQSV